MANKPVVHSVEDIKNLQWRGNHFLDFANFDAIDTFLQKECKSFQEAKEAIDAATRCGIDNNADPITDLEAVGYLKGIGEYPVGFCIPD